MKNQAVCEYCGRIFEEKFDKEGYGSDYEQECVEHEIIHLNLEDKFRENLQQALDLLDKKYNGESKIKNIEVTACWDSYYGRDITYRCRVQNNKLNEEVYFQIEVDYYEKENIPTIEETLEKLEQHFFIPTIDKKYEGIFKYESYNGGDGADDYIIGSSYMRTIYDTFKGKKVRIEIID